MTLLFKGCCCCCLHRLCASIGDHFTFNSNKCTVISALAFITTTTAVSRHRWLMFHFCMRYLKVTHLALMLVGTEHVSCQPNQDLGTP